MINIQLYARVLLNVASYDNYMLIYSYLTFCFLLFAFLLFSMTTLLQLGVSLNLTKTNFMIFHPRQKKVNVNVPLTLENTVIKQVTETKFLGVLIDQHLSWKPHIDFVSKKISKSVGIIAKARFYLSSQL